MGKIGDILKITTIYEVAGTDGIMKHGDGLFFLDSDFAVVASCNKHGQWATEPIQHFGIEVEKDKFVLLKSRVPIVVESAEVVKRSRL